MNFYMDDSGARHPDHKPNQISGNNRDWFSLGGILIKESDEPFARAQITDFCKSWNITIPLHSVDIRHKAKGFNWLSKINENKRDEFYSDLSKLMISLPVIGIACVIDRPGYNHRYLEKYGRERWRLCKTAFAIAVERAAKYAVRKGYRLRILPERCSKTEDNKLKGYYDSLRKNGLPFSGDTSGKYQPLTSEVLTNTLYEFKLKHKISPLAQIADLYLWPICMGGYHRENKPYQILKSAKKLVDDCLDDEDIESCGIKYSCFELRR